MPLSFVGSGAPLTEGGVANAADLLAVGLPEIWTILRVETSGCGYLADRRPAILFERHYFSRLTGGTYDADHPDISASTAGGYGAAGPHQYDRLGEALVLNEAAALQSASWGVGQIMGAHYGQIGYADVNAMVQAFVASEDNQLTAVANFLRANGLAAALSNHSWAQLARGYNGPNYAQNNYDTKLGDAYAHLVSGSFPNLTIRAAQMYLMYLGYDPGPKDGVAGGRTYDALNRFQQDRGLPPARLIDTATVATLAGAVSAASN